jgi:uncharacterized protein YecT (DUF1311 family)
VRYAARTNVILTFRRRCAPAGLVVVAACSRSAALREDAHDQADARTDQPPSTVPSVSSNETAAPPPRPRANEPSAPEQEPGSRQLPCWKTAVTQDEVNRCASAEVTKAQAEMKSVFERVLKKHASEKQFVHKLHAAQSAWQSYRDAELQARFPSDDTAVEYGSVFPMCWSLETADLVRERTKALRAWLEPVEGEVCDGSRR